MLIKIDSGNFRKFFTSLAHFPPAAWLALFLAAVVIICRLLFIFDVASYPLLNESLPKADPFNYDLMARNLLKGQPLELNIPGHPVFIGYLSHIYSLFGQEPLIFYLIQFTLSLTATVLLALIGMMVFGLWPGVVSALIYVFYKMNFLYDVMKAETALTQFLIITTLFFFVAHLKKPSVRSWLGCAVFGVLLSLLRIFCWVLTIPAWAFLFIRNKYWQSKKYIVLYSLLALAAVFLFFHMHGSNRYSHKFGIHFFIGSSADSLGLMQIMEGISPNSEGFARDAILVAYQDSGSTEHLNWYWIKRTLRSYLERPVQALSMWGRKINYLVNHYEPHNNTSVYYYEKKTLLGHLPRLDYGIIFTLASIGMIAALWQRHRGAYLLIPTFILAGLILLVFICSRYRMPLIPFYSLFAGFGLCVFVKLCRNRKLVEISLLLLISALIFSWTGMRMFPFDKAQDIQHWERKEILLARRQEAVEHARDQLMRWDQLPPVEKVDLAGRLEQLSLKFEFDQVYHEALRLAEDSADPDLLARLLQRRAAFYESNFDFQSALDIWLRLEQIPAMTKKAAEKIHVLQIIKRLRGDQFD